MTATEIYQNVKRSLNASVTLSRIRATNELRILFGTVRSYPYWTVALRTWSVISRSSFWMSVATLDKFWTCSKNCYEFIDRSVSVAVRTKPYWSVLVRNETVAVRTFSQAQRFSRTSTDWYEELRSGTVTLRISYDYSTDILRKAEVLVRCTTDRQDFGRSCTMYYISARNSTDMYGPLQ